MLPKVGLDLLLHSHNLSVERGQDGDQRLGPGSVSVGDDLGLAEMLSAQRSLDAGSLLRDVASASKCKRGADLRPR